MRKRDNALIPALDLRPAEQFGSLSAVFDHEMDPSLDADLSLARARLRDYDDEQDYILPTGSPLATFTVGMLLHERGATLIQVLEWDRFALKYHVRTVQL